MICGEVAKLTGKVRMYSTMKMAKTKLENVIGDTTMKMANAKGLKIKACFFEISYVVSYIYVLYTSQNASRLLLRFNCLTNLIQ